MADDYQQKSYERTILAYMCILQHRKIVLYWILLSNIYLQSTTRIRSENWNESSDGELHANLNNNVTNYLIAFPDVGAFLTT